MLAINVSVSTWRLPIFAV